jgi:hypothetical protein
MPRFPQFRENIDLYSNSLFLFNNTSQDVHAGMRMALYKKIFKSY